jgi:3-hydroxyacyl-[acyl-carrier-protein] dehydratase
MPPKAIVDLATLDLEKTELTPAQIYGPMLPHAHELALLSGVHLVDKERGFTIGWKDVRQGEFWCRGHFPTRPILPGVLIVEAAAQLSLVHWRLTVGKDAKGALLFGGIEDCKFRDAVEPGSKLVLVAQAVDLKVRRSRFKTQGFVDGKVIYEGDVIGILGPELPA